MANLSTKAPEPVARSDVTPQAGTAAGESATSATVATETSEAPSSPAPPSSPPVTTTASATAATPEAGAAATSTTVDALDMASAAEPDQQAQVPEVLPASHWAQIPAVYDSDDEDSAYGGDNASSTASLSASILEYRTMHGRTFHSELGNAQSWNPNDAQHDECMDILHHVSTLLQDGKIYLAPIDDSVQKVLDVGCGTGLWAIDFADQHPGAEVTGVDISAQQPQWIPPNLKFEIDDVTRPWTYKPNSFDYIHMRWLVGSITDWTSLYKEVFKALKPGGWFENKESSAIITSDDGTVADGSALDQWGKVFGESGKRIGRSFRVVEEGIQRKAMEEAGFVDIREHDFKTPLGDWPADPKLKEIGQYNQLALEQDIEGFLVYVWITIMGWTKEEISVYAVHLRRELRSRKVHPYYPQKVVIGRKPE
ncbi:S-adenosyl-L-methionine-dependent methyltransferase [Durotheca rogersii]|uniref:S-adenosyl-L-methionine-dependent methyltransferase n=1 Tax=Durotheca rogersii TaxID=419775 RepID=UPI00221E4929|nr:S-adenosyl-L-methionine-dependent methyltransferase [Durotheca rogersii]KAI5857387.1 S-adenosyl-L-methionine-dependent methyltransferase [Durotheca rogersii]